MYARANGSVTHIIVFGAYCYKDYYHNLLLFFTCSTKAVSPPMQMRESTNAGQPPQTLLQK